MFKTESKFVRWLQGMGAVTSRGLRLGIGDDAALVTPRRGHDLILTTDLSIEGVHYLRALHPPRAVGHRALARSLSDVAAMGGVPRYALISLAIHELTPQAWLEEFYAGVFALARRFHVAVVGGDTAMVPGPTAIDVVVVGDVERSKAVRRSSARPGDQIFVSGRLGMSALGLRILRSGQKRRRARTKMLSSNLSIEKTNDPVRVHLYPEPRCALGRFVSQSKLANALIDLSDGLSTDLHRLCQASNVGARLWAERIPLPDDPTRNDSLPLDALDLALNGGEDYELLFTVPPGRAPKLPRFFQGVPLHWVGEIRRSKEVLLELPDGQQKIIKPAGYDHFGKPHSSSCKQS